ncbi:hypothetical protein J8137_02560 [Lactiplantibacillus plantarum]|nr:hypothetical protein [Lactiplantibacillus plantarum]
MMWLTVGAIPYLSTLLFQNVFHWSPLKSGVYILFIFVGNIGIKPLANNIIKSIGFKYTIIISLTLIMITTISIGILNKHTNSVFSVIVLIFSGVGRSLALTAYNGMSLIEVPFNERNSANTLSAVNQNLYQGLGISLVTIIFSIINQYTTTLSSYRISFIMLGTLIIVPLAEIFVQPRDIGTLET